MQIAIYTDSAKHRIYNRNKNLVVSKCNLQREQKHHEEHEGKFLHVHETRTNTWRVFKHLGKCNSWRQVCNRKAMTTGSADCANPEQSNDPCLYFYLRWPCLPFVNLVLMLKRSSRNKEVMVACLGFQKCPPEFVACDDISASRNTDEPVHT